MSGSLQARSSNLRLLEEILRLVSPRFDVLLGDQLRNLLLFNSDLLETTLLRPVAEWRQALASFGGVVIACPEYGHSLPGEEGLVR